MKSMISITICWEDHLQPKSMSNTLKLQTRAYWCILFSCPSLTICSHPIINSKSMVLKLQTKKTSHRCSKSCQWCMGKIFCTNDTSGKLAQRQQFVTLASFDVCPNLSNPMCSEVMTKVSKVFFYEHVVRQNLMATGRPGPRGAVDQPKLRSDAPREGFY